MRKVIKNNAEKNSKKVTRKRKGVVSVDYTNVDLMVKLNLEPIVSRPTTSTELLDLLVVDDSASLAKKILYQYINSNTILNAEKNAENVGINNGED